MPYPNNIYYIFTYQSQQITFSEWINLFTLCLAPFIAHILVGAPDPTILACKPPPWVDRFCQYNPTSILWRYFVIADRRIRARNWSSRDMIAANAIIWTNGSKWLSPLALQTTNATDGKTPLPVKGRISFLSPSALKTLLVTIQGVQSLYVLITGLRDHTYTTSISTVFFPLSVLGLLRLPAALWLFDESAYFQASAYFLDRSVIDQELLEEPEESAARWHSQCSIWGILPRLLFGVLLSGLLLLSLFFAVPYPFASHSPGARYYTTTNLICSIYYTILVGFTLFTWLFYVIKGRSKSTIIPCLSSLWYKIYTGLLFFLGCVMIIISAFETRRMEQGNYTSFPVGLEDRKSST